MTVNPSSDNFALFTVDLALSETDDDWAKSKSKMVTFEFLKKPGNKSKKSSKKNKEDRGLWDTDTSDEEEEGGDEDTQTTNGGKTKSSTRLSKIEEAIMLGLDINSKMVSILSDQNAEGGSGKTKWTKRFHLMKQTFILFASTTDVTTALEEPPADLKMLFESNKTQVQSMVQHSIVTQRGGTRPSHQR